MKSSTWFSLPASMQLKVFFIYSKHTYTHTQKKKKPILMVFPPFLLIFYSVEHLQIPSHGHQQEFCLTNEQKRN